MQVFKSIIPKYFQRTESTGTASTEPALHFTSLDNARDHISTLNFSDKLQALHYRHNITDLIKSGKYAESASRMLKEAIDLKLSQLPALKLETSEQATRYTAEHFKTAEERGDLTLLLADKTVQESLGKPACDLLSNNLSGVSFSSLQKAQAHIASLKFKDVLHAASYRNDMEDLISQGKYDQQAFDVLDKAISAEAPGLPELQFKDEQAAIKYLHDNFKTNDAINTLSLLLIDQDVKQHLSSSDFIALGNAMHKAYDPSVIKYKENENAAYEISRTRNISVEFIMQLLEGGRYDPITDPQNRTRFESAIDNLIHIMRFEADMARRPGNNQHDDARIGQGDVDDLLARNPQPPVLPENLLPLENGDGLHHLNLANHAINDQALNIVRGADLQPRNLQNNAENGER